MRTTPDASQLSATITIVEGRQVWRCELPTGACFRTATLAPVRELARERLTLKPDAPLGVTYELRATTQALVDDVIRHGCDSDLSRLVVLFPFGVADIAELTGCSREQIQQGFSLASR